MPNAGDVFIVKDYVFPEGDKRDKWFVVLNTSDLERPCLALMTTSQDRHYQNAVEGCNKNHKCFYIPKSWATCFTLDTYVQLPRIVEFPAGQLLRNGLARRIEFKDPLPANRFAQLKQCLPSFKEDIAAMHWNLIYKT